MLNSWRVFRAALTAAFSAFFVVAAASAQEPAGPSLATVEWLAAHIGDPALVVLHVGDKAEYDTGHIPGARFIELRELSTPRVEGQLSLQLPSDDALEQALEGFGIGDASTVVVYFGKDWVSPTTRIVFTLDYAGLGARTRLLDGGMPAWVRAGHTLSTDVPAPAARGSLTLRARRDAVATLGWLQEPARATDTRIVDARNSEFYTGASDGRGSIPRPGHIAGAVSLPFGSFVNDDNTLKSREALEQLLATAGVSRGKTTVTYCHIGQQATVPYVVARMLGFDVRLYDGSFEEWARTPTAPVTRGDVPE